MLLSLASEVTTAWCCINSIIIIIVLPATFPVEPGLANFIAAKFWAYVKFWFGLVQQFIQFGLSVFRPGLVRFPSLLCTPPAATQH